VSLLPARVSSESAATAVPGRTSAHLEAVDHEIVVDAITSASVRTGARPGAWPGYAFRSRLNPKSRTVEQFAGIGKPPQPLKSNSSCCISSLSFFFPFSPFPFFCLLGLLERDWRKGGAGKALNCPK